RETLSMRRSRMGRRYGTRHLSPPRPRLIVDAPPRHKPSRPRTLHRRGRSFAESEGGWCCGPRGSRVIVRRAFRFSSNIFAVTSRDAFVERCRQVERLGYDTVFAPDHLGAPAPFPLLVAAAGATERLQVGTLVLNVPFWNPALLAREAATTDILTDGRFEL